MTPRRWTSFAVAWLLALGAAVLTAPAATAAVDNPPDGSRAGLGWTYVVLAIIAIIGILLVARSRGRRK